MAQQPVFLTEVGLQKAKEELEHLRNDRRPEVAGKLRSSKELESAANNAEYDGAKNEQAFIEGRILTLETLIEDATIIHHDRPTKKVMLGSTVKVRTPEDDEETYVIVGSSEADPGHGRISNESPVGRALLGRRGGDEVKFSTPVGARKLKLVEVS